MGLILDSSILIANERGRFDLPGFLRQFPAVQPLITAITAAELLHGVERAQDPDRRARRQLHVEQILASLLVLPFDLAQARWYARLWAELESRGLMIGPPRSATGRGRPGLGARVGHTQRARVPAGARPATGGRGPVLSGLRRKVPGWAGACRVPIIGPARATA